jgi:hypothetical protein
VVALGAFIEQVKDKHGLQKEILNLALENKKSPSAAQ